MLEVRKYYLFIKFNRALAVIKIVLLKGQAREYLKGLEGIELKAEILIARLEKDGGDNIHIKLGLTGHSNIAKWSVDEDTISIHS